MENGQGDAPEKPPEAQAWIENGVLRVTMPLLMPNGEYIAYGMLHKAQLIVASYFAMIEREAAKRAPGPRILTPTGSPVTH